MTRHLHRLMERACSPAAAGWNLKKTAALTCLILGTSGCQTLEQGGQLVRNTFNSSDPCASSARNVGILAGGVLGAVIGSQVSDKKAGIAIGAGLGATLGGLIGNDIDRRRCELHQIAQKNQLELLVSDIQVADASSSSATAKSVGMSVSIIDTGEQFPSGSSAPTAQARKAFAEVAQAYRRVADDGKPQDKAAVLARLSGMRILLIGHTDDTGNSRLNADLAEARASEIAKIFAANGFTKTQIFYQGAGETLPIADNNTAEGRAKNRRVEIVDLSSDAAFTQYLASRRPNLSFYREASAAPAAVTETVPSTKVSSSAQTGAKSKPASTAKTPTTNARGDKGRGTATATATNNTSAAHKAPSAADTAPAASSSNSDATASTPAATSTTAARGLPASKAAPGVREFDFGGTPIIGLAQSVDIGELKAKSTFSLVSSAHANLPNGLGSCQSDRPRVAHGVKSLANSAVPVRNTAEYMPGLYNTSWVGMAGGHLIALNRVAVLRDGGAPANPPEFLVYDNYQGDTSAKASFRKTPEVNTYQGDKALLYRVFVGGPVQCLDVVIPNTSPREAPQSNLVYAYSGQMYQVKFAPRLAK
ncbi:OmpA family protein [Comamonas sp. GB3 AK4-5]|uniref:OmpA family protein n=1 Tax=Comamonas sp. GB3 AK4-5 TaxID=3231487 RepID=UPI00351E31F2